jgi:hypothetical protein
VRFPQLAGVDVVDLQVVAVGRGLAGDPRVPGGQVHHDGEQADGRALDIALDAGDLAGETQPWVALEPQLTVQNLGRVEKSVSMETAKPCKFGLLETRNAAKNAQLLAMFELGLETHHVVKGAEPIVLPELDDRIGLFTGLVAVGKAPRFHRPVT